MYKKKLVFLALLFAATTMFAQTTYKEKHRSQFHFSPPAKWMNDPNGMVFHKGIYHLFYQFYPDSTVWGPMHWGHARSSDLVHWDNQPIALYPDSLGYIFSGSAVADTENTSGFGKDGKVPLVAIFTHHDPLGEKAGGNKFQNQSIAYSLDDGKTWEKYAGNPVLKNPGIRDFRDPKVMWFAAQQKWIMTLATLDKISFYSSKDLKNWVFESDFGKNLGAHGGVWECPDLFPLKADGKTIWVLLVSINPGGPNGGSATQYFTGNFDGKTFTPNDTDTKWVDYGTDNYAGVTWAGTGDRKVFLGWMSNWQYATVVPTQTWRSATTLSRDLGLKKINNKYYLSALPVKEFEQILKPIFTKKTAPKSKEIDFSEYVKKANGKFELNLTLNLINDFEFLLFNDKKEQLKIGFNKEKNEFFIDRSAAGNGDFNNDFKKIQVARRVANNHELPLKIVFDEASVEFFADNGLTVLTAIYFPDEILDHLMLKAQKPVELSKITISAVDSIWKNDE